MSRPARLLAALVLLALSPAAARSWGNDPYLGPVAICVASSGQYESRAVSDGAGGMFVAWRDLRVNSGDIYVQHVNAQGTPLWTSGGVSACAATALQYTPVLVADGSGGCIVAWLDARNSATTGVDVYANRVNSSGVAQWGSAGAVVCNATADAGDLAIAPDNLGGAYFAWLDKRANIEIYAQRMNGSGVAQWTANGISLSGAGNVKATPALVSDGGTGAICAWMDARSGNADIYAGKFNSSGTPSWGATGLAVCVTSGSQDTPVLIGDGSGGAVIAWLDDRVAAERDVYAKRIKSAGTTDWSGAGNPVCTVTGTAGDLRIVSDAAAGAILSWLDARSATARVYARRITADGGAVWTNDGVDVSGGFAGAANPRLTADAGGGAIVGWSDARNVLTADLFAQRVSAAGSRLWKSGGEALSLGEDDQVALGDLVTDGRGGALAVWDDQHFSDDIFAQRISQGGAIGDPEPAITRIRDVLADQGGHVVIEWNASYLDTPPQPLSGYSIWRRVPSAATAASRAPRPLRQSRGPSGLAVFWEFVDQVPARARPGYSYVAATTTDSMPGSNPRTSFMVSAEVTATGMFYDSAADSGYSVDNLAPAAPLAFTGQFALGGTALHWARNSEADLAGYRLYRGSTPGFVTDGASLVAALSDTGYTDAAGAPYYYKLTAADLHGNESPVAFLLPQGTTDAAEGGRAAFFLAAPSPNPLRAGRATMLRFGLASRADVSLALFDASGRRVRTLARGTRDAGEHAAAFDGRDGDGRALPPGVYLARLQAAGRTALRRVIVLD